MENLHVLVILACRQVTEAIQIGAQAIKDNKISIKEVQRSLQELEESIDLQKQVESALGSLLFPLYLNSFFVQVVLLYTI